MEMIKYLNCHSDAFIKREILPSIIVRQMLVNLSGSYERLCVTLPGALCELNSLDEAVNFRCVMKHDFVTQTFPN